MTDVGSRASKEIMISLLISTDLRGSPRVARTADGAHAAWFDYDPFGRAFCSRAASDAAIAARLTRRYTGQAFDAQTGLYHCGARLYDDALARFVSADPAQQDASPYVYCSNDPVDAVDADGRAGVRIIRYRGWYLILDADANRVDLMFGIEHFSSSGAMRTDVQACRVGKAVHRWWVTVGGALYFEPYRLSWQMRNVAQQRIEQGDDMPALARRRLDRFITQMERAYVGKAARLRKQYGSFKHSGGQREPSFYSSSRTGMPNAGTKLRHVKPARVEKLRLRLARRTAMIMPATRPGNAYFFSRDELAMLGSMAAPHYGEARRERAQSYFATLLKTWNELDADSAQMLGIAWPPHDAQSPRTSGSITTTTTTTTTTSATTSHPVDDDEPPPLLELHELEAENLPPQPGGREKPPAPE